MVQFGQQPNFSFDGGKLIIRNIMHRDLLDSDYLTSFTNTFENDPDGSSSYSFSDLLLLQGGYIVADVLDLKLIVVHLFLKRQSPIKEIEL